MSKMCKCKACGAEIAKSANTCPHCGAPSKKKIGCVTSLCIVIIFVTIIFCAAILGDNAEPEKVGPVPTSAQQDAASADRFRVGDVVTLSDIEVTLLSCEESAGSQFMEPEDGNVFLVCEFLINNKSANDISVSSLLSFEAYVDDFSTSMSLTGTVSSGKTQLDGTIAAGKKMTGAIAYEAPESWSEIEIRFTPNFWSGNDIIFVAEK